MFVCFLNFEMLFVVCQNVGLKNGNHDLMLFCKILKSINIIIIIIIIKPILINDSFTNNLIAD